MAFPRTAVLVDGDNIPDKFAQKILEVAAKIGQIDVARAYAVTGTGSTWTSKPGFRYIASGKGKNTTDILLCVDAMHLVLKSGIEKIVIATSDGDFSHLAERLREYGVFVLGIGETKAPQKFRAAVSDFRDLTPPKIVVKKSEPKPKQNESIDVVTDLDCKIRKQIAGHSHNGSGVLISTLSVEMRKAYETKISNQPEKTWRKYLNRRNSLYSLVGEGAETHVRFLPAGFAASPNSNP